MNSTDLSNSPDEKFPLRGGGTIDVSFTGTTFVHFTPATTEREVCFLLTNRERQVMRAALDAADRREAAWRLAERV